MDSSKKLVIALAVLAALIGAVYLQRESDKKEADAHSIEARTAALPKIEISEEQTAAIDTIELHVPAKEADAAEDEEGKPPEPATEATHVVLTKVGEDEWQLKEPVTYKANASNVKSLLNNLKSLKITEQISPSAESYDKWGVDDVKGLQAVFKKGDEVVLDVVFGESGSRGQMTRLKDKEGVYAVKGYSQYLYAKDVAGWRDKTIFKFDDKDAQRVVVENEHGTFTFERSSANAPSDKLADGQVGKNEGADKTAAAEDSAEKDDKAAKPNPWAVSFKPAGAASTKSIDDFKPSKVDDLLRAFKSLNASKFGDDKTVVDVGLAEPKATLTIEMKDGSKHVLLVGDNAEGTARWVKTNSGDTIFSISSWSADWVTAEPSKFQDAKKEEASDTDTKE